MRPLRWACLGMLLACALRAEAPPAWVKGGGVDAAAFPPGQYLTGYGVSAPGGDEAERRIQAVAMAREALAASIRVRVFSEFTSKVTQQDKAMSHFAQNLVRTRADLELEGVDASRVWQDPKAGVTYALVVLDRAHALRLLDERLAARARACAADFERGRKASDPGPLLKARRERAAMEEDLVVRAVLGGGAAPAAPALAEIDAELRGIYLGRGTLDDRAAAAALELGGALPRGTRLLLDRVTYRDTPFCGTFSAWLEQTLGAHLAALGQAHVLDKAAGHDAIRELGPEAGLAQALKSQAVVRGTCFDLGPDVQVQLRAASPEGEELASASLEIPATLVRKAGLKLAPDNLDQAQAALAIEAAQVQATQLKVKVALDRGDGGIYRKGDKLHIFVKATLDCHVKVLYRQADGSTLIVFPNRFHPDDNVPKGQVVQIPPDGAGFDWVVQEPFGVEMVKVVASTEPIEVEAAAPDAQGMREVKEDLASLLGRTRGIHVQKAQAQYAEDFAVVNTLPGEKEPAPRS